jgi:hypothetical protein
VQPEKLSFGLGLQLVSDTTVSHLKKRQGYAPCTSLRVNPEGIGSPLVRGRKEREEEEEERGGGL